MKNRNKLLIFSIILIAAAFITTQGSIYSILGVDTTRGSVSGSTTYLNSQMKNSKTGEASEPSLLSTVQTCSSSDYDSCYYNSNDVDGYDAKALSIILVDDFEILKRKDDGTLIVDPEKGIDYECSGTQAFFFRNEADVEGSSDGYSVNELHLEREGFLQFGDYDVSSGFKIGCFDYDKGSDGSWAWTWVSSNYGYSFQVAEDSDGDGLWDFEDECLNTRGLEEFNGCPDSDGDGVKDSNDLCPDTFGLEEFNGCPDSDGDGVKNSDDLCVGTPSGVEVDVDGCPVDSDDDGVADYLDNCTDTPGEGEDGCPLKDLDGDGVFDRNDDCESVYGSKSDGCPTFRDSFVNFLVDVGLPVREWF